jgi:hypothetical protein
MVLCRRDIRSSSLGDRVPRRLIIAGIEIKKSPTS